MATENNNNLLVVHFEGFHPDEAGELHIKEAISKLLESCPYDSRAVVRVFDMSDRYKVEITIQHAGGKFAGTGEEVTLREAINAGVESVNRKIEEWRMTRFKDGNEGAFDVLLVDDDPLSIKLLESCFHQNGCRTVAVENGERALEKIEKKKFDLIVMDWNMPRLDGSQTLCALDRKMTQKSRSDGERVPVLTYSVYEKNKIDFPITRNFFRMGHMSKMASYQALQNVTGEFLRKLKGASGLNMALQ